jgi:hypothetical protein
MSPKKALLVLLPFVVLLILTFVMVFVSQSPKSKNTITDNLQKTSDTGTENKPGDEKNRVMEKVIEDKVEERKKELIQRAPDRKLQQDEIDFLINPKKTIEKELIEQNKASSAPIN